MYCGTSYKEYNISQRISNIKDLVKRVYNKDYGELINENLSTVDLYFKSDYMDHGRYPDVIDKISETLTKIVKIEDGIKIETIKEKIEKFKNEIDELPKSRSSFVGYHLNILNIGNKETIENWRKDLNKFFIITDIVKLYSLCLQLRITCNHFNRARELADEWCDMYENVNVDGYYDDPSY